MKILIACEYSGRVRNAFAALGHDAMSCDLLPTELPGNHYQGDVRDVLHEKWDLLIAHPECTYLTNAGVCHLHKDPKRWPKLFEAAEFFKLFLNADHIQMRAIENPIMHGYAKTLIGGAKQSQVVQPWMFGHMEQKATCLWLKGLAPLNPTNVVKEEMMLLPKNQRERLHYLPPSPDRWKERSRTYQGIADAMAMQWGGLVNIEDFSMNLIEKLGLEKCKAIVGGAPFNAFAYDLIDSDYIRDGDIQDGYSIDDYKDCVVVDDIRTAIANHNTDDCTDIRNHISPNTKVIDQ